MGKRFLTLLFLFFSFGAFAYEITVISDLDDTIKRTNVDNSGRAIYNALFTQKVFAGMPQLFETLDTYTESLYVLSNSPSAFRFNILKLLKKHHIHAAGVSTRKLLVDTDGFTYKYNYIVSKIKNSATKVILFGDDVGRDPEVYAKVKANYPQKVAAIYIHKVKNRKIPLSASPYISFFDVALYEYRSGRMNLNQAMMLGDLLEQDLDLKKVLPDYAYCPKDGAFWRNLKVTELNDLIEDITYKITKFCNQQK